MQLALVDFPATKMHEKSELNQRAKEDAERKRKRKADAAQEELAQRAMEEEEDDKMELEEHVEAGEFLPSAPILTKKSRRGR